MMVMLEVLRCRAIQTSAACVEMALWECTHLVITSKFLIPNVLIPSAV